MAEQLISAVVPVHNGARYLRSAIDSILAQRIAGMEIVVVDDGSDDGSGGVAEALRAGGAPVVVVSQPRSGVAAARNHGVAVARGSVIAFCDADDLWTPNKLEVQLARLRARPELDAVFGLVEEFVDGGGDIGSPRPATVPGTMLINRPALERVGPFPTDIRFGDGMDWYMRAMDAGLRTEIIQEVVLRRRVHAHNMTRERADMSDYLLVLRRGLRRRRETSN